MLKETSSVEKRGNMSRVLGPFILLWAIALISHLCMCAAEDASGDLCSNSFCKCPEAAKLVLCECESQLQRIAVGDGSLPRQTEKLSIRHCGELTIAKDSFRGNRALRSLELHNLNALELGNEFYSSREHPHAEMHSLSMISIGKLRIRKGSFRHFPKCAQVIIQEVGLKVAPTGSLEILTDIFLLNDNNIGILEKSSLYSDAANLTISHNRIELIESGAFDASVQVFNFVENTVDKVMHNGISAAFQEGVISRNTFTSQKGSPFMDVGPDPTCTADPESDYDEEETIIYNIVSNPSLTFTHNTFLNFSEELLIFPGANNVPLGSLHLEGNVVKCNCEDLLDFAILVDYGHLVEERSVSLSRGDVVFRKEFYDSGRCIHHDTHETISLKRYMRETIVLTSGTPKCFKQVESAAELIGQDSQEEENQAQIIQSIMKEGLQSYPSSSSSNMISSSSIGLPLIIHLYLLCH